MQIATKQTVEHTVDIELPFFRKKIYGAVTEHFGMIMDGFTLEVYESDNMVSVASKPRWMKETEIVDAYTNWSVISEAEFLEAHQSALNSLSLVPVMVNEPAANADDIRDLNI